MAKESNVSGFFKHSSIYAIGNILNRIGAFILLPIYTTHLSLAEYGTLELFYVVLSVVSGVLAVGLAHATLRFYFEYDDINERNAVVSTNIISSAVITLIGVLIVLLIKDGLVKYVFGEIDEDILLSLYLILATMVLELSSQVCLAYIRARELSLFYVYLSLIKLVIQVSINSYMILVMDAGISGILFGNLIAVASGWLVLIIFTLYSCGLKFHMDKMKAILMYSFPFLLGTLVGIVAVNADRFMLNEFMGLEAVGVYALAMKLTLLVEVLVAEPFSKAYGSYRFSIMKNPDAGKIQSNISRYMAIIVSLVMVLIVYSSHEIIVIMSNPEYYTAVTILPILIFIGGFKVYNYLFQTGILYAKATKYMFHISIFGCISIIILNYIFINAFGLIGACIAKVGASGIVMYITNRISQKYLKIEYPYIHLVKVLLITITFIYIGVIVNDFDFWLAIAAKAVLFISLIVSLYYSGIINAEEKFKVKLFLKKNIKG